MYNFLPLTLSGVLIIDREGNLFSLKIFSSLEFRISNDLKILDSKYYSSKNR